MWAHRTKCCTNIWSYKIFACNSWYYLITQNKFICQCHIFHLTVTSNESNLITWRQLFRVIFCLFSIQIDWSVASCIVVMWNSFYEVIEFCLNAGKVQRVLPNFPCTFVWMVMLDFSWLQTEEIGSNEGILHAVFKNY